MTGTRKDWFPTAIWHFDIEDGDSLNSTLLREIYRIQQNEPQSLGRSAVFGWHSHNQLHKLDTFQTFTKLVIDNVLEIAQFQKINTEIHMSRIDQCWALVNSQYAHNTLHNHPNSIYSGVYYLKAPSKSGSLIFRDPREISHMWKIPVDDNTIWTAQNVEYEPKEGRMIIFPSWLLHQVQPNLSTEDRVSISFNISFVSLQ
ncbi:MAG: TIGR02466 family protein [Cyanobacteria bacterium J06649_4]